MCAQERNYHKDYVQQKTSVPERRGDYLGEKGDKFYVALSPNEVYELSPLAYYIWLLCDGQHTLEDIAKRMSKDLSIDINEAVEPLMMAIEGLTNVNLVVIRPSKEEARALENEEEEKS